MTEHPEEGSVLDTATEDYHVSTTQGSLKECTPRLKHLHCHHVPTHSVRGAGAKATECSLPKPGTFQVKFLLGQKKNLKTFVRSASCRLLILRQERRAAPEAHLNLRHIDVATHCPACVQWRDSRRFLLSKELGGHDCSLHACIYAEIQFLTLPTSR